MRLYSSENKHNFTNKLFEEINAYGIENITMDVDRKFTAIVEAAEFNDYEKIELNLIFSVDEIHARMIVSEKLEIPFYFVAYKQNNFYIYKCIEENGGYTFTLNKELDEVGFVKWWSIIKGTKQTHKLNNGAQFRVNDTIFHKVLKKYDLKWGGNIDGVIVEGDEIVGVIDNISIAFVPINHYKADPALFFFKRGPRYETWFSTVKLSMILQVPHLLLTLNKNDENEEIVGLTVIDYLSRRGIFYVNDQKPYENIVRGLNNIKQTIDEKISNSSVPQIILDGY